MKNFSRRSLLGSATLATCMAALHATAWAQAADYPHRTMKIVVPFSPGGGGDVLGRLLADRLSKALGQAVIVENKPGASSVIATDFVAKSEPDGHTILLTVPLLVQTPALFKKLPYQMADLTPVVDIVTSPLWVAVNANTTQARNLKEFVAELKARPATSSFASIGNGSSAHLLGAELNSAARLDMLHVPYKGSAAVMTALLGGETSMALLDFVTLKAHVATGKIRLLAVTGEQRSRLTPEVPTFKEQGFPGFELPTWAGLFVPNKTPASSVARLHAAVGNILQEPEVVARFADLGYVPGGKSQGDFAEQVTAEQLRWGALIRKAGVQMD